MLAVAGLAQSQGRQRPLEGLLRGLTGSILAFRGAASALARLEGALKIVAARGPDDDDQDSYYEDAERGGGRVDPGVAAKGLGEAGKVHIAQTLWRKLVPENLL